MHCKSICKAVSIFLLVLRLPFIFEDLQKHLQKQSSYSFWSYSFWSYVYLHFRRLAKAFVFDGGQEGKWRQLKKGKSLQWIWWGSWESQEEQTWTCTRLRRANFDFKHIVRWQKLILLRIHLKRNNLLIEAEKQIKLFDTRIEFDLIRARSSLILSIIQTKLKQHFVFDKLSNSTRIWLC